jgi:hypothetical protein
VVSLRAMAEAEQTGLEEKARKSARRVVLFLAVVFAVVPIFLLVRDSRVLKVVDRLAWRKVPCEILSARVERVATDPWYPYEPVVKFRCVLRGVRIESESVGEAHYALYDEADAAVRRMSQGRNYCYVGPHQTVLVRFSGAHRIDLLYFGGFLAVAMFLFVAQLFIRTVEGLRISRSVAFASLFVLAAGTGLGMSGTMIKGIWKASRAAKWTQVPCTILFSDFQKDRSDGKTIYRPDVLYRYEAGRQSFVSSRVDFFQEGESRPQRGVLAKYPEGNMAVCYVNPRNVGESVLQPEWSKRHVGFAAMGLFIAGLGGGVLSFWFWPRKIKAPPFTPAATETVLHSVTSRTFLVFVGILFVLGNGVIVSQFFGHSLRPGLGWVPWAALLCINVFLLATLGPHLKPVLLSKAVLRLPQNHLARGGATRVAWKVPRNTRRIELSLICVEWKSKLDGFNEVFNEKIFAGELPQEEGEVLVTVPATAPKSVLEKDHVVEWAFKVRLNSGTWRSLESLYVAQVT